MMNDNLSHIPGGELVTRFTPEQAELAAKISNDIAEDIDCHESRAILRMAIAYYHDVVAVQSQELAAAKTRVSMFETGLKFMNDLTTP